VSAAAESAGEHRPFRFFVPIDDRAKDGAFYLLRDSEGSEHCGRWDEAKERFVYSSGARIAGAIVTYCTNRRTRSTGLDEAA